MKRIGSVILASTGVVLALTTTASAHVLQHEGHWHSGLTHPLLGVDHLLALLAVGMWAALLKKAPTVCGGFLAAMLAGGLLGLKIASLPAVELVITLSIFCLGAFLIALWK